MCWNKNKTETKNNKNYTDITTKTKNEVKNNKTTITFNKNLRWKLKHLILSEFYFNPLCIYDSCKQLYSVLFILHLFYIILISVIYSIQVKIIFIIFYIVFYIYLYIIALFINLLYAWIHLCM